MHFTFAERFSPTASIFILLASSLSAAPAAVSAEPAAQPDAIVIGFLGGFVGHTNAVHTEVQLAKHLRDVYPSGVQVRMFANHNGQQALQEVLRLLDANHDGELSAEEKSSARIAIYGHSWGASETVTLARALARDQIPVLLTVQVDSVEKRGENDASIPANVTEAVNFYQRDGFLHGRTQIHAADASHTQILGNFQSGYKTNPVSLTGYPWYARLFMKPHIEIESDPAVWQRVESLIRGILRPR
jgi:hypothetical protein